jgi:hypothetical protein
MTPEELKRRYNAGERDFQGVNPKGANLGFALLQCADLQCADLPGANLKGAYLERANLKGAHLERANLERASLYCADFQGADLQGANLQGADLRRANLGFALLQGADLRRAYLGYARLQGANLQGAKLKGAYLERANLQSANLENTCLAPDAVCAAPPTDRDIAKAGLELHGDRVYGWRTRQSQHCGSTVYEVGKEYTAPWFSVDHTTECHPGLYLAGRKWLTENYYGVEVVRVYCKRDELVRAWDKWRARRLWVVANDEP